MASAVATLIKKRRRTRVAFARQSSLKDLRSEEKKMIARIVRDHRTELVKFKEIMRAALATA